MNLTAFSPGELGVFKHFPVGVFCSGDVAAGCGNGTRTGPQGKIHGLKLYDGPGFWIGGNDESGNRKAGRYFFDPARSCIPGRNTPADTRPHCFAPGEKIEI